MTNLAPSDPANGPQQQMSEPFQYSTLNAMRGVAAIAVMMFHNRAMIGPVAPRGYLAVDLFFVLSGFVIDFAYADRLARGLALRDFVMVRMIRFWPLYALGLIFGSARELLLILTHNSYALPWGTLAMAIVVGCCSCRCRWNGAMAIYSQSISQVGRCFWNCSSTSPMP